MAVAIGTIFGSIEITGLLGKGGMGEVYRARDLRLKREVAIKILPDEFLRDADRVSRFEREAEVLASLNHPNIATIHSIEEENGSRFLVLELVEGDTLADRIARGPLPVTDALQLAKSMCEALESAHEKGVIHRDLKPANVKVTPDGKVKVLDFGLAKAMENTPAARDFSQSPTMTLQAVTQAGMILGTAAYMSPEQAKGLNTDQRSDIFSFGAVLFEMVTGRQAFQGDNVSEILASILAREPDLGLLPPRLHPKIIELLRRALEKNPKRRWHAIGDLRLELESVLADPYGTLIEAPRAAPPAPLWKRAVPIFAAVAVTAATTSAGMWYTRPATPKPVTRFSIVLPEGQQFSNTGRTAVSLSPDGTQIVYVANQRLQLRALSDLEAKPLSGTETLGTNPFFSPDGRSVVFWSASDQLLKKVAVGRGAPVTLGPADNPFGMRWDEYGIVFGQGSKGVMRVSENGGTPEVLVTVNPGELATHPQILPGGKHVLYSVSTGASAERWDKAQMFVQSLAPGSPRQRILEGGSDAHYVPTGHVVYAFGGTLFAVPFDLGRLAVTGAPVPVVEGVRRAPGQTGAAHFSFSSTGSLVYLPGPAGTVTLPGDRILGLFDRQGGFERLKVPQKSYAFPRVSPDGKWVAVSTDDGNDTNVWIVDMAGAAAPRQLTLGSANRYPVWSPDGRRVAFQSDREGDLGIFWQIADGSGTAERLTEPEPGVAHIPDSWSPDGKSLAFTAVKGREGALWILSIPDKTAKVFAEKASTLIGRASFSPDGRWVAYQSDEIGNRHQIFVQSFPASGAKYAVTPGGHPFWSLDGRELALNPGVGRIGTVSITTTPGFSFGTLRDFPGGLGRMVSKSPTADPRVWDFVPPDGKRLIGVTRDIADDKTLSDLYAPHIHVVLNWFEDLKQRMSAQ